jgi:hypothetical protein
MQKSRIALVKTFNRDNFREFLLPSISFLLFSYLLSVNIEVRIENITVLPVVLSGGETFL